LNKDRMPKRLSRKTIVQSPWVNHHIDQVEFPGGRIADQHHILEHDSEAVAALITNSTGDILMIQAYRYVTNSVEWEIPAGLIDAGESVIEAGKREVFEETGYEASDLKMCYTYHPMNGISNKVFNIITGRASHRTGDFDINEVKSVTWHTPEKIRQMIANNTIKDGYTLTALLLHLLQHKP
jgi:ADP-ribose pyrophosphatase